jgi:rhodanese-related sulfurtransferase
LTGAPQSLERGGADIRTIDELLAEARSRLDRVRPEQALAESRAGALVVDTRCAEARHAKGVIPGSVHVPLSVLFWRLDPTSGYDDKALSDRARRIIVVCADGYSSSLAAATLRDLGFLRATDLDGGFNGWVAAGLPVERTVDATAGSAPGGQARTTSRTPTSSGMVRTVPSRAAPTSTPSSIDTGCSRS